ncbi:MAG: guanylate kinase [Chthonomonadaceae bacterium]|nr:guanylate kinase [Chthonomonadaceae bacterium]
MSGNGTEGTPLGRLFVVSGPSGVGKGTLLKRLFARVENLVYSISATTRPPRPGEVDGVSYHFYTREQFEEGIEGGFFFEYAAYNGNLYGTPADSILQQREQGLDVVLEIEVQGAMRVHELASDAILIYIKPPSREELERRLRARRTESEERILSRLTTALYEESFLARYDYVLVNSNLDVASDILCAIIESERKYPK